LLQILPWPPCCVFGDELAAIVCDLSGRRVRKKPQLLSSLHQLLLLSCGSCAFAFAL
jgi:hypothetical protein